MSIKQLQVAAFATVVSATLAACGPSGISPTSDAKTLIDGCHGRVNSFVAIDASASGNTGELNGASQKAITDELSRVAACGGQYRVSVFTSSSAATVTLTEGSIPLVGATNQAKAKRLRGAVSQVVAQVANQYRILALGLDPGGSDPVAQLRLFSEWTRQIGNGHSSMLELTDGFQNAGITTADIEANPTAAASRFPLPNLASTEVTFAGIGRVSGPAPTTETVDALKSFYQALCERSAAASCTVVTDKAGS